MRKYKQKVLKKPEGRFTRGHLDIQNKYRREKRDELHEQRQRKGGKADWVWAGLPDERMCVCGRHFYNAKQTKIRASISAQISSFLWPKITSATLLSDLPNGIGDNTYPPRQTVACNE